MQDEYIFGRCIKIKNGIPYIIYNVARKTDNVDNYEIVSKTLVDYFKDNDLKILFID
jgi:hypothetical protein